MVNNLRLVAFDMDGVLVRCDSSWVWVHRHFGVSNETSLEQFIRGEIDDHEFMRKDISLWKQKEPRLNIERIGSILDQMPEIEGVGETIAVLKEHRIRTVIVSGGLDLAAQRLAERYDFDGYAANGLEVDEAGLLTGRGVLRVELVNKRKALDQFLRKWGIERQHAAAVGNSSVDVSMFQSCGYSVAFNPIDPEAIDNASVVVRSPRLTDILPPLLGNRE
jgi:phosphoserine phosphatase